VALPFLPGDFLLLVAGAFAAKGDMSIGILNVNLCIATVLGDSVNYEMGSFIGHKLAKQKKTGF
jgi:membrane-associated protein